MFIHSSSLPLTSPLPPFLTFSPPSSPSQIIFIHSSPFLPPPPSLPLIFLIPLHSLAILLIPLPSWPSSSSLSLTILPSASHFLLAHPSLSIPLTGHPSLSIPLPGHPSLSIPLLDPSFSSHYTPWPSFSSHYTPWPSFSSHYTPWPSSSSYSYPPHPTSFLAIILLIPLPDHHPSPSHFLLGHPSLSIIPLLDPSFSSHP
ncbi:hypothetical protein Pcinc_040291 [Petrolisthes cinctipes]|uniref:Uncharacterized protein n=1 Tax=Petrolisthes cinctipes TaxID=88211 RepID=A0AAE1EJQ1_PETCI|nr:hypothetical protein Pcinc_040291 [Petrolisthes cinctipes]